VRYCAPILCLALLGGCYSAGSFIKLRPDYSQLPVQALHEVARDIERAVQAGNREAQIEGKEGIVVDAEEIRQAVRTRAARYELVSELLTAGYAYEGKGGLLWMNSTKEYKAATTRRQRNRDAMLVNNENSDRWILYEGILKASGFSPRSLGAVKEIFYKERVDLLGTDQCYENPDGAIVRKGREDETAP
jgi:hypothetical protein